MKHVVATGDARVTETGARLLGEGGNAFDAVVAAGFAAAVAEAGLTSLGGGGFLVARPAGERPVVFDFFVDTPGRGLATGELTPHFFPITIHFPASHQVFNVGWGSVAVPGTLLGLLHVHRRLGRRPLSEVVAPAAALAREGVRLTALQAYILGLLFPILTQTDAGRRLYAPAGRPLREGERLLNPELADFLEALPADGGRSFYGGEFAARIARDMAEGQGLLTEADLAAYAVVEREPLAIDYRGHRLLTNPPPASGGELVARGLSRLERHPLPRMKWSSAEHLEALAEAMVEMERTRGKDRVPRATRGTTHASIADAEGNVASMTTSNGEGSGYVVPGTGIMLNNMLGEEDLHPEGFHASPAGERVGSMMSPAIVQRGDEVVLVLGSGGSKRIRTAVLQVASAVVDFGAGVREAVEAPRLHWDGELLQMEPGFARKAVAALGRRWPINPWPERNLYFGGVHAVSPSGQAAGDPRRGGVGRTLG